ncbi:MAG TPA: DUF421 domain-containing protein [Acidobacteriota bacterium]|nr:DUF421 domain-containing protein [Acidobacteriota bacterium]
MFSNVDWSNLFLPSTPLVEILLRGTIMYLALFVLLRVILKRQSGSVGLSDILVVVLIADAAQNALADDYRSLPDGILLVATILFWSFALDWIGYRFPSMERILRPRPLHLIYKGRILRHNMRRELVTDEELMSIIRREGFEDVSEIKEACMEADGEVSIVPFKKEDNG